jgi:hypothetical protein
VCIVYITRSHLHLHAEIAGRTCDLLNLGVCNNLNIRRPTGLHQLGRQYSYGAVVGRKGLVQGGHESANG